MRSDFTLNLVCFSILGLAAQKPQYTRPPDVTCYNRALEITGCESIEATVRKRKQDFYVGGGGGRSSE